MFKKKILMKYLSNFVLQSFMVLNVSKTVWIHKSFKTIWYKADSIDDLIKSILQFLCGSNVRHCFHEFLVGFVILLHIYNPK